MNSNSDFYNNGEIYTNNKPESLNINVWYRNLNTSIGNSSLYDTQGYIPVINKNNVITNPYVQSEEQQYAGTGFGNVPCDKNLKLFTELLFELSKYNSDLKAILENAISVEEAKMEPYAKMLEAMGGYSPTMGIIGAVLGLIHAMSLLDRPDELGPAIAVAFVATIYGLVVANIICLPSSNRVKSIIGEMGLYKYMTLEGLVSIAAGENTMMLKRRLAIYTGEKAEG